MNFRFLTGLTALGLLSVCAIANAQFYTTGSEPASIRWRTFNTPHYKIIFPEGTDSLAIVHAKSIEAAVSSVSGTTLFSPNENYRKRMPVILHTNTSYSNGYVTWTPRRLELISVPEAYSPIAMTAESQLALHEVRHVAQMQFGAAKPFRFGKIISGELLAGGLATVYGGSTFFEGDAVTTETSLSRAGRGRSADFLEYYMASLTEEKKRDYWKWKHGSQRHYTPDYYRAGYVMVAGIRTLYDAPDFATRYYQRIQKHGGIALNNLNGTVKEISGKKFNAAFSDICDSLSIFWKNSKERRGPFMEEKQLTPPTSRFTEFHSLVSTNKGLYAIRSGITRPSELVKIDSTGAQMPVRIFSKTASTIKYDKNLDRLYWSEYRPDPRYELRSFSDVRYLDSTGKKHLLLKGGRYYNPSPSPDGSVVAVTEYLEKGGSRLLVADANTGAVSAIYTAPNGVQIVESTWIGERIFVSFIDEDGFGIKEVKDEGFLTVLKSQPINIKQLWSLKGELMFVCDMSGANELYSLDPNKDLLLQQSSTSLGASDFCFDESSGQFFFSSIRTDGRPVFKVKESSLLSKEVSFRHQKGVFPMADELSVQERENHSSQNEQIDISPTRKYSKLANLFRVHSWLPMYINYNEIEDLSFSSITSAAGLGGTLFMQNHLGDAYGVIGYHAARKSGEWRHSGHFNFTYAGWYPVLQIKASVNERNAIDYSYSSDDSGTSFTSYYVSTPLVYATLSSYIPFNFSRGGLNKGLIPRIEFAATNDSFHSGCLTGTMSRLTASLRGYIIENTPSSRIYPRFGVGAEAGYSIRPMAKSIINPAFYLFGYAYLPAFHETHGIKFTALYERRTDSAPLVETLSSTVPRGFSSATNTVFASFPSKLKLTLDYAMPLFPVDWSGLGALAYVRNFEFTPHCDISFVLNQISSSQTKDTTEYLYSIGADFCVRLSNLLIIPYDTRIGVSYDYNGGSSLYSAISSAGYETGRHSVSLVFNVSF